MGRALLTAAELSGDAIAAALFEELVRRDPSRRWSGFSGPKLEDIGGFETLGSVETLSGAGLVELLPRLPTLLRGRRRLLAEIETDPDLAVFVDAPDLHLPLARRAKARGVRTVQLVVPQFWAWRPGRKEQLARDVQLSLCLFPFEVAPLRSLGAAAHWVGHPLVDAIPQPVEAPEAGSELRIAVLPGSRPNEVKRNLPAALAALEPALGQTPRDIVVAWCLATPPPRIEGVRFSSEPGQDVLAAADLALVAFGTACLEAALLGVPTLSLGSAHPITARFVRPRLQTRWLALPNILVGRPALAEHLLPEDQDELASDLRALSEDLAAARSRALELSEELRGVLGHGGFAGRTADCIEALL